MRGAEAPGGGEQVGRVVGDCMCSASVRNQMGASPLIYLGDDLVLQLKSHGAVSELLRVTYVLRSHSCHSNCLILSAEVRKRKVGLNIGVIE